MEEKIVEMFDWIRLCTKPVQCTHSNPKLYIIVQDGLIYSKLIKKANLHSFGKIIGELELNTLEFTIEK